MRVGGPSQKVTRNSWHVAQIACIWVYGPSHLLFPYQRPMHFADKLPTKTKNFQLPSWQNETATLLFVNSLFDHTVTNAYIPCMNGRPIPKHPRHISSHSIINMHHQSLTKGDFKLNVLAFFPKACSSDPWSSPNIFFLLLHFSKN